MFSPGDIVISGGQSFKVHTVERMAGINYIVGMDKDGSLWTLRSQDCKLAPEEGRRELRPRGPVAAPVTRESEAKRRADMENRDAMMIENPVPLLNTCLFCGRLYARGHGYAHRQSLDCIRNREVERIPHREIWEERE